MRLYAAGGLAAVFFVRRFMVIAYCGNDGYFKGGSF